MPSTFAACALLCRWPIPSPLPSPISQGVVCHGLLWLLDRMMDADVTDRRRLYSALKAISAHPRVQAASNRGEQTHIPLEGAAY